MGLCSSMTGDYFLLVLLLFLISNVVAEPGAADALLEFKRGVGNPRSLRSWASGDPCLAATWRGIQCSRPFHSVPSVVSMKLSDYGLRGSISPALGNLTALVTLWLDGNRLSGQIPYSLSQLKNLTSLRLSRNLLIGEIPSSLNSLSNLQELLLADNKFSGSLPFSKETSSRVTIRADGNTDLCSPTGLSNVSACAPSLAPALVLDPGEGSSNYRNEKPRSHAGAIAGGVAGAIVLVGISIGLLSLCLLRAKNWPTATSDTGSSDPSAQAVDWSKSVGSPLVQGIRVAVQQQARQFSYDDLDHATTSFSSNNMIGRGRFGLVYKGLLHDGTIVAIKIRSSIPSQEFISEAVLLAQIRQQHVVSLLGYCQEHDQQMLVYDYLPNGSVSSHLYDNNGNSVGKLDLKQRLSIALGAARGLEQLHAGIPSIVHGNFKASNVLLDDSLLAKVTDFGLSKLMPGAQYQEYRKMNLEEDVYSYGSFLFELVSGREAVNRNRPQPQHSLVEWARMLRDSGDVESIVDGALGVAAASTETIQRLIRLAYDCIEVSSEKRPSMTQVTQQLEEILNKERGGAAEGSTVVTLGSELFT